MDAGGGGPPSACRGGRPGRRRRHRPGRGRKLHGEHDERGGRSVGRFSLAGPCRRSCSPRAVGGRWTRVGGGGGGTRPPHGELVPIRPAAVPGSGGARADRRGPPGPLHRAGGPSRGRAGRAQGGPGRPVPERAPREHACRAGSGAAGHAHVLPGGRSVVLMATPVFRALVGAGILLALGAPNRTLEAQGTNPPVGAQSSPPSPPQARVPAMPAAATGWLGVRVRYEVTERTERSPAGGAGPAGRTAGTDWSYHVRVEEVFPEGPARASGVAPGDRILRINGVNAGPAIEEGILSRVRPNQAVEFEIERNGSVLQLRVVAASRPPSAAPTTAVALARVRTDSIVSYMQNRMDSARASVAREAVTLRAARPEARPGVEPRPEARGWVALRPGFPVPVDSALTVRREAGPGATSAGTLRALLSGREAAAAARGAAIHSGPVIVYATGQRAVLGAEITPVNPGLAGYFGVDAGLLVTQVVEGAPGARGGLTPGDVIVRVGSRAVSTVEEFRAAAEVGIRSPPLVLGVIREGGLLELRIPR
ncbi:MAG: PDZ domain-containing protein [Gemmatimonadales bacterium]|nr:MAG: PDZ domain-containing protein [Gemmatimonadales bacterium]